MKVVVVVESEVVVEEEEEEDVGTAIHPGQVLDPPQDQGQAPDWA